MASYNLPEHLIRQLGLLQGEICNRLSETYPRVTFLFNMHRLLDLGITRVLLHIKAKTNSGNEFMLGDGGFVDWTQVLLSDGKERLMTSAIGTELLCRMILQGQKGKPEKLCKAMHEFFHTGPVIVCKLALHPFPRASIQVDDL